MTATLSTAEWRALAASGDLVALAKPVKTQPTGEFLVEPKFDGWRLVAIVGGDRTHLYARSGQSLTGKLPAVEAELFERFPAGTVLDGEAVALRVQDGKILNEWSIAQNVLSTAGAHIAAPRITFMVFDLLAHAECLLLAVLLGSLYCNFELRQFVFFESKQFGAADLLLVSPFPKRDAVFTERQLLTEL